MTVSRKAIVDVARSYVGTPFAEQGRQRGIGLDCVGLPLMIAEELGLRDTDGNPLRGDTYTAYPGQPTDTLVLDCCIKHLVRKTVPDMRPGDVLTMRVESLPCHVGIYAGLVNGVPHLIHAYSGGEEKVVEHGIDYRWARRITACFEFPNVED